MSLKEHLAALSGSEPIAVALRLTAVEILLRPMGPGWIFAPLVLVATLGLLATPVLFSAWTWYAASALVAARIVVDWPEPDNHIYLLGYWCLAIGLALGSRTPAPKLAHAGRLLLGFAFAFAVIWKAVLSPEYRDGRFFTVTLLTDPRFADVTQLVGRMSPDVFVSNRRVLDPLPDGAELADPPSLNLTRSFGFLAFAATWGTLFFEALLAVAFLTWKPGRLEYARHGVLLLFCLVTYAVAPVAGFGWLLLAMGCALCRPDQHILRAFYVAAWFVVLFYGEIPWAAAMLRLSS